MSTLSVAIWLLFIPLSILNVGSYEINGEQVTGRYFLVHADPWLALPALILGAIAYGYWTERVWARPLPLVFWFGISLVLLFQIVSGAIGAAEAAIVGIWCVASLAVVWWYSYRKHAVANYYRALESKIQTRTGLGITGRL